ncbi:hypothetical protein ACIBCT_02680 [Streptosporangium sp. NPDC050855]|uniref:hypothetical protein n=1 Tax=Streptosporangium sp. NPDC050855 TaxID=3366194 RepID=UPI00379AB069
MDDKPLAAADQVSRPSPPPPSPPTASARPSRVAVALRRTGIAVAGIGVAALTAAACVLSFEDLRVLAVAGRAPAGLAYLYPAAFDALLVIAMIGVLLLRGGWWPVRLQAGLILTLLFAGAVAAEVVTAMRVAVDEQRAAIVVAVAPWVILILALWLWLLLIKHAAARRAATDAASAGRSSPRDIVPFPGEGDRDAGTDPAASGTGDRRHGHAPQAESARPESARPESVRPEQARPEQARTGQGDHHLPGHHGQLVHHPAAEIMLDPHAAPPLESVPHHDLPPAEPVIGPTPAPETPEVTDIPRDPPPAPVVPAPAKPMRWGDLVRPREGDVLVHPPRPAAGTPRQEDTPGPRPETRSGTRPEPSGRVGERIETWDADTDLPAREAGTGAGHDTSGTGRDDESRHDAEEPGRHDTTGARQDAAPVAGRGTSGAGRHDDAPEVSERDADTQPIRTVPDRPGGGTTGRPGGGTAGRASAGAVADRPVAGRPVTGRSAEEGSTATERSAREGSTADEAGASGRKGGGSPDPAHGAEAADSGEETEARTYDDGTAAPPSGRMRSTPVPPGEE